MTKKQKSNGLSDSFSSRLWCKVLAEASHDMIFALDPQGKVLYVNSFAAKQFGKQPEQLIGKLRQDLFPGARGDHQQKSIQMVARTGKSHYAEEQTQFGDRDVWLGTWLTPIINKNGKVESIMGISRDITDRKLAEIFARKEKERAEQYLNVAGVMMVGLGPKGEINMVNKKGLEILGYQDEKDLIGKNWFSVCVPKDEQNRVRKGFRQIMTGKMAHVEYFENSVVTKKGERRLIAWHNGIIRDEKGLINGVVSSGEDITDKREIEVHLKEAEARYRDIVENAPIMIHSVDTKGRIVFANKYEYELLGYKKGELIGMHIKDLYCASLYKMVREGFEELQKKGVLHIPESCMVKKNGGLIDVEINSIAIYDKKSAFSRTRTFVRDITAQKQAKKALESSERSYRLLANNSTDLIWTADIKGVDAFLRKMKGKKMPSLQRLLGRLKLHINYSTPAVEQIINYTPEEFVKLDLRQFFTPESYRLIMKAIAEEILYEFSHKTDLNRVITLELEQINKDGKRFWVETKARFLRDEKGNPVGFLGVTRDIDERRQIEKQLTKFKLGIERSADMIFTTDVDGNITYVNPALQTAYGYQPEDVIGKNPRIWKSDRYPKSFYRGFWKTLLNKKSVTVEFTNRKKDGSEVIMQSSVGPILDDHQQLLGFLAVQRDITQNKVIQVKLKESEQRYRDIVENSPEMIHSVDSAGHFVFVNKTECIKLGYKPEELIGQPVSKVYSPELIALVAEGFETLKKMGSLFISDGKMMKKNGDIIDVEIDSLAISDQNGKFKHIRSIIRDVTYRHKAEEELRKLKLGLELSSQAVFMTDVDGKINYVNSAFTSVYGYTRAEAIGKTSVILKSGKHSPDFYKKIWKRLLNKESFINSIINKTKDGRFIYVHQSLGPILDDYDRIVGFMAIQSDVTELENAKAELSEKVEQMEFIGRLNLRRHKKMLVMEKEIKALKEQLS